MRNHKYRPETLKNQPGTKTDQELWITKKPSGTMKNRPRTSKNQPGTLKTHNKWPWPIKINLNPWKPTKADMGPWKTNLIFSKPWKLNWSCIGGLCVVTIGGGFTIFNRPSIFDKVALHTRRWQRENLLAFAGKRRGKQITGHRLKMIYISRWSEWLCIVISDHQWKWSTIYGTLNSCYSDQSHQSNDSVNKEKSSVSMKRTRDWYEGWVRELNEYKLAVAKICRTHFYTFAHYSDISYIDSSSGNLTCSMGKALYVECEGRHPICIGNWCRSWNYEANIIYWIYHCTKV